MRADSLVKGEKCKNFTKNYNKTMNKINFCGEEFQIDPNFYLVIFLSNEQFDIQKDIFSKLISLDCSIHEEFTWRQTMTDLLMNTFPTRLKKKKNLIMKLELALKEKRMK